MITVWEADLDMAPNRLSLLAEALSPDERSRAARYRRPADARRFVAGRGLLRALLARCLDVGPAAVRFAYGPHGKPALTGMGQDLRFNVSHSAGRWLCAVALGRDVGVDLEAVDEARAALEMSRVL